MKFFYLLLLLPLLCFSNDSYHFNDSEVHSAIIWQEDGRLFVKIIVNKDPLSPYNHIFEVPDMVHSDDCPCVHMNY